ncbi:ABC-type multidrug transport system permease component [Patulibacter medicamentivorans]|uniref:ABC-type multidrug transport system permease component n=1 Tax=Patulibacter medicamentivorans TaxID=1097667 RepID=H0E8U2_9ACTN|nr:ABC transporter permease [Patulibacter medicamentivorans]EHN09897.1 ABC-type multidrug transport system permease component [Patulibacter medicamentivorans]
MSTAAPPVVTGQFTPNPGRAPLLRMLLAQTRMELTLIVRNGEQVLLNLIVPLGLLIVCTKIPFIEVGGERADFFVPGVLALAVMSAAFTGQAIATGFDRQYGVLKRLGATALPRTVLLGAKTAAVLVVELLQIALLCGAGIALGWHPHGDPFSVAVLIAVGTAAFCGMAFLMAGLLRAMTTLALANILWFLLLIFGGIAFPLSDLGGAADVFELLPSGALSNGLRMVLETGEVAPVHDVLILGGWAVVTLVAAAATFRWE